MKQSHKTYFGKRLFDIFFALLSIILFSPLFALTVLLVYWKLGRPIFFKQKRGGLNGTPFYLYKFRSMINAYDDKGKLLPDEQRLYTFGKILRSTSLDEIPTFYHVLKGDMSIVGPRPLIYEYVERYSEKQKRRLETKPGITGWAQIDGRNAIGWEEKFDLDVYYVDNQSLLFDFKILFTTLFTVLKREGISSKGSATMHEFKGDSDEDT